ncbi:pollen allergen Poa pIX/Phl pVI [Fulvivirga imtechensis AK7]|uniref:Pollen allergen Poa pIX/Phl pVI n=1 Tax=Fulvivirga imtechensis AK7 TaxID=1237149 RepID=L8JR17_9BACT|nr:hypothetical protein [Fulvivirga imtechensis]ELR70653.1 pollen allergen Poa pIX/Phl pVI [Fulvivirga imtechensis AK7]
MKTVTITLFFGLALFAFSSGSFKDEQKRYPRVRSAYVEKELSIKVLLESHSIDPQQLQIYLRAFKEDKKIELWAKNMEDDHYQLIKEYDVCRTSGIPGPKREQGDLQIPEGFYHIDRFNPSSNFHLSLGINYPNQSDRILGTQGNLGGDIFIHGACVTIGCLPITDDYIKELYIIAIEAKDSGQQKIPVTIFPLYMTDDSYSELKAEYQSDRDKLALWDELKTAFDHFNKHKDLPQIKFLDNGRHEVL